MRIVIPKTFIARDAERVAGVDRRDVSIPTVGDLVNRRTQAMFPHVTVDDRNIKPFGGEHAALNRDYACLELPEGVFELKATVPSILGNAQHEDLLDLQDIRACCSAYIAGSLIPKEELLDSGGMMAQYTKYLISDAAMEDEMQELVQAYAQPAAGKPSRDIRMPDVAAYETTEASYVAGY